MVHIDKIRENMIYAALNAGEKVKKALQNKYNIRINKTEQKIDEGIPADVLSHNTLYNLLHEPGITIISEESNTTRGNFDFSRGYIIDPLDGTGNASGKRPHLRRFYSISIAYFQDGKIEAGVIHFPELGITITDNYRVHLEHKYNLENLVVAADTYKKLMTDAERKRVNNRIKVYELLENKYNWNKNPMYCATGESLRTIGLFNRADIHFSPSLIYAWDFAASSLIMNKNGITIINLETMDELDIITDFHNSNFRGCIGTLSGPDKLINKITKYL